MRSKPMIAGFARGQLLQFQEMGFGVAAALILDATLIRLVILPSTLSLLGQRSWYLPRWLDWLPHLQVEPPQAPPASDEPVAAGGTQPPALPGPAPAREVTRSSTTAG